MKRSRCNVLRIFKSRK